MAAAASSSSSSSPAQAAFEKAVASGKISETSRQNYEKRLRWMEDFTGKSVRHLLLNPSETYAAIKKRDKEPQTRRTIMTAFLAVFRHDKAFQRQHRLKYQAFRKYYRELDTVVQARYDANEPTCKQREAYMPFGEVLAKRDALPKSSDEYLLLCMYTMIPPARADYNKVRILHREPEGVEATTGNYMVVRQGYARLVLNEFKSKGRSFPQHVKILPRDLEAVVRESLRQKPREYLFVSPRTGAPYDKDNTFVVYVNRVFERVLGKRIGISMMRHIYVNSLDLNALTSGERKRISQDMMHSLETNDRYRLKFGSVATSKC